MTAIYPGMTAGEARAAGENIDEDVPDDAILVVDGMALGLAKGSLEVEICFVNPRWSWDPRDQPN